MIIALIAGGMILLGAFALIGGQDSGQRKNGGKSANDKSDASHYVNNAAEHWSGKEYRTFLEQASRRANSILSPAAGLKSRPILGDGNVYEAARLSSNDTVISNPSVKALMSLKRDLVLCAPGGMGKSVLMRYLFLTAAASFLNHRIDTIPLLLEAPQLRAMSESGASISGVITAHLKTFDSALSQEQVERDLREGCFLFLLDGADELERVRVEQLLRNLNDFRQTRPGILCIAASHPRADGSSPFQGFAALELQPLSQGESVRLAKKLVSASGQETEFPRWLRDSYYDEYPLYTQTPLMLSLFCLAFLYDGVLPDRPAALFDAVFKALTKQHWERFRSRDTLDRRQFQCLTACFCRQTFFLEQNSFPDLAPLLEKSVRETGLSGVNPQDVETDFIEHLFLLVRDGIVLRFVHPDAQAAFAALYDIRCRSDEEQRPLFRELLSQRDWETRMDYFSMLHQLEPEKFAANVLEDGLRDLWKRTAKAGEDPDIAFLKVLSADIPWEYDSIRDLVIPRAQRNLGGHVYDAALVTLFRKFIVGSDRAAQNDNFNWQAVDPVFERLPNLRTYEEVDIQLTPAEQRVFYHAAIQNERISIIRDAIHKWLEGREKR